VIKFNMKKVATILSGDNKKFDDTELKNFDKNERENLKFHIRSISAKENEKIKKRCYAEQVSLDFTKFEGLSEPEKIFFLKTIANSEPVIDFPKMIIERLKVGVTKIEGIVGDSGEDIETTPEFIEELFTQWPNVGIVLSTAINDLTTEVFKVEKTEKKK